MDNISFPTANANRERGLLSGVRERPHTSAMDGERNPYSRRSLQAGDLPQSQSKVLRRQSYQGQYHPVVVLGICLVSHFHKFDKIVSHFGLY